MCPEVWTKIEKGTQNRAKQEWKNEKPKLDNARRLPDDQLSKMRGENWKAQWQQPCRAKGKLRMASRPCLRNRRLHPRRLQKRFMGEKWKFMNPQSNGWNLLSLKFKGFTSMDHYNLVHKFILTLQAIKNFGCKSCSGQGMEKARDNPSMATRKTQEQEEGYS